MADPASKFTDEELKKVEKQLKSVYSKAYLDILQKQNEFNRKYEEKSKKYLEKVAKGEMTQDQYDSWLKGQVFQGDQWQAKKEQMLNVIHNSNKTATDILNGKTRGVFAFNATYANYDLEHGAGINFGFGIYDTNTVINLVKNDPKLLPEWKIDQAKDYKWSQKKLNKQISLGILEGESLDKIATRLCNNLCTTNFNKMRTFARTAMTGAQNEGRLFSYENAKALGIKVKKQWMCTLDSHTRIEHQKLDGQTQDIDKPFEVDGLKIRYPGDPTAEAALVFNCRCTMVGDIEDYPATYDRYDNIDGRPIKQMTYEEWLDAKSKGSDILPVPLTFSHTEQMAAETKHTIIQGQDISTTWKRRPDQFDFEIEDVINAQGFDGLPRVVSAEEFNEAVKAANGGNGFIAQRTYSAPDQETLDAYRQQLYEGKWYVDCSTGGAQYGQGMYCAADYSGTITKGITDEMKHYQMVSSERIGAIPKDSLELIIRDQKNRANDVLQQYKSGQISKEVGLAEYRRINSMNPSEYVATYMKDSGINGARSYVETMTLDSSAKIITYDDIFQMKASYPEKIRNQYKVAYLQEHSSVLGEDGIEFAKRNFGIDGYEFDWKRMNELYGNMSDEAKQIANEVSKITAPDEEVFKYNNMDLGAFAVLNGYDAINATGHGASSSYTVVLNRTKLIIKEP